MRSCGGFVYEILAVAGWVAAALAAFWCLPWVQPLVHPYINSPTIADIVGRVGIFLVVLLVCSVITHAISKQVQRSAVGSVDRSLGFAFGLVRGLILEALLFMVVTALTSGSEPEVLATAKTRPLLEFSAGMLKSLVPPQLAGTADEKAKRAKEMAIQAKEAQEMYQKLATPQPKAPDQPQNSAKSPEYDKQGFERLLETNK